MNCPKILIVSLSILVTSLSLCADQEIPKVSYGGVVREGFPLGQENELPEPEGLAESAALEKTQVKANNDIEPNHLETALQMTAQLHPIIKAVGVSYTIQVSAYFAETDAKVEQEKLQSIKLNDVTIAEANIDGKTVFRVCTGIFKTWNEATKSIGRIAHETRIKDVFVQKIMPKMTASN